MFLKLYFYLIFGHFFDFLDIAEIMKNPVFDEIFLEIRRRQPPGKKQTSTTMLAWCIPVIMDIWGGLPQLYRVLNMDLWNSSYFGDFGGYFKIFNWPYLWNHKQQDNGSGIVVLVFVYSFQLIHYLLGRRTLKIQVGIPNYSDKSLQNALHPLDKSKWVSGPMVPSFQWNYVQLKACKEYDPKMLDA